MSAMQPSGSAKRKIPKLDVAQICLNLQDRLGLAKVRYERTHRHRVEPLHPIEQNGRRGSDEGNVVSDTSSEICDSRYETPFTSSPLPTPMFSRELPRSSRSKHAATFFPSFIDNIDGSRKRGLSSPTTEQPSKAPRLSRISWKAENGLPQSSPVFSRPHHTYHGNSCSFISESDTIPDEEHSPAYQRHVDEIKEPELPIVKVQNIGSSGISSSPPRTPPPNRNRASRRNEEAGDGEDGADLLLFLANSPTPAIFRDKGSPRDFPPSTPPSQRAVLPSLTATPGRGVTTNFGTPTQQFNFADFVNVTPSPAQLPWGGRTPGTMPRTPRPPKELKKRLNFDSLAPPLAGSPSTVREKRGALHLQLGEELRP
ncbi:hypothetical protein I7I50_07818 [Histoplasma capsulatum G186AR]|uniref:Uncharacterized protein n=1 Tax=Ajellomyces capsulatus TaxID=5037 RepID=A0A8H7YGM1_AJECA|nr:hypothetical protein I7I52_08334 [Histoplasma capsulatum]QSS68415.1 hypothetical protein I7I50_07818 [Histoplasma capsulatum G186AR]